MPEKVVDLLKAIESVKGREYTKGLVDMANMLAPMVADENKKGEKKS